MDEWAGLRRGWKAWRSERGGARRAGRGEGRARSVEGRDSARGPGRFGFGGGPRGPRGPHGRGGRIFGPGDLRFVLLAQIREKPRHGYELIKALEQKFGGAYAPSPGSVYPTLTLLEEIGQLRSSESEGAKRLFRITADGEKYLDDNEAALQGALTRMEMAARAVAGDAPPVELMHAMQTLKASLLFHRGGWDAKELARVRGLIEGTAAAIAQGADK